MTTYLNVDVLSSDNTTLFSGYIIVENETYILDGQQRKLASKIAGFYNNNNESMLTRPNFNGSNNGFMLPNVTYDISGSNQFTYGGTNITVSGMGNSFTPFLI